MCATTILRLDDVSFIMFAHISPNIRLFTAVPDPPFNLEIHSKTWESVELSWQPGFNGGYTQAFVISYMSVTEKPGHVTVEGATRVNVTMLYPSANYSFQVQGQNQLGEGKMSVAVATETNCKYL